jgi:hypothetical protein
VFAFFAMFLFPTRKQIGAIGKKAHDTVDVVLRDGLQNDPAKVILRNVNLRARLNPVFTAKLCRDHKLALRGECRTKLIHVLHYIKVRPAVNMLDMQRVCMYYYDREATGNLPPPSKCASISSSVFPFVSGKNATAVMK